MSRAKIYKNRKTFSWGIILSLSAIAYLLSVVPPFNYFGISPLIIAIILGAFVGNTAHKSSKILKRSGVIGISTKQILRLGIILYGFRITIADIEWVGFAGLATAFIVVFSTFFLGYIVGNLLGLDKKSTILISSGSSICGAAAVLATQSVVKGTPAQVGIAICTVVLFGTIGMFLYPIVFNTGVTGLSQYQAGFMSGATLHEVAHAVAAGAGIGEDASKVAVIVKMLRVLMLVPFLLMLSFFGARLLKEENRTKSKITSSIPWFAIYFLVAVLVGSLPMFPTSILPAVNFFDTFLLSMAMVSLGFTINRSIFAQSGKKPFILAIVLMLWLVILGLGLTRLFLA